MTRPLHLALAAILVLLAGCTFERRPPAEAADTAAGAGSAGPTGLGVPAGRELDGARAFFLHFQSVRDSGGLADLRALLHPDALLFLDGRRITADAPGSEVAPLLAPGSRGEAAGGTVEEVAVLEPGILFVVRYPPSEAGTPGPVETAIVVRDPPGWSVRFLQRIGAGRTE